MAHVKTCELLMMEALDQIHRNYSTLREKRRVLSQALKDGERPRAVAWVERLLLIKHPRAKARYQAA